MTKTRTPQSAQIRKLTAALEATLDVMLDGRTEDLDEKEQAAYDVANEALASVRDDGVPTTPQAPARRTPRSSSSSPAGS
jgi:hypothetical protein